MNLTVSRDLLPELTNERDPFLKKYFCELAVTATAAEGSWSIKLFRPHDADFYIDPNLQQGLQWWSKNFGKIDIAEIPLALYRTKGWQLSLNDSWTLYSWSKWLQESGKAIGSPACVTVLHLDDHDDLMTPRIRFDGPNSFRDLITGATINLEQPESVASAVTSGAIGIGSFMAPFLHKIRNVHVRHLCSTEYTTERKGPHAVSPIEVLDELLAPGSMRPGLQLHKLADPAEVSVQAGALPYIVTDDLDDWLKELPAGPVVVHIDMDYFNNRFNGDSDWVDAGPKYDPPLPQVLARIDAVFESLERGGVAERVEDFAVAMSPGFFPADLWEPSITRIDAHVKRLLAEGKWTSRE